MSMGQLTVFGALKEKMQWHQARQSLLAENVANAETPGYRGRDLAAFDLGEHLKQGSTATVKISATQPNHISIGSQDAGGFRAQQLNSFEVTPEGNGVVLEDEMMKVSSNQLDFQAATTLYTRSMRLLKTAIGR